MHAAKAVGHRIRWTAAHGTTSLQVRCGYGDLSGLKIRVLCDLIKPPGVRPFDRGTSRDRQVHPHGSSSKEDLSGHKCALHQAPHHFGSTTVMHNGTAATFYGHAIVSIHLIASQHKNHLEPRKRTHEAAMFLSKAGHGLRRDKRKVHTGFQQEAIAPRKLVQVETLGMAHKVG